MKTHIYTLPIIIWQFWPSWHVVYSIVCTISTLRNWNKKLESSIFDFLSITCFKIISQEMSDSFMTLMLSDRKFNFLISFAFRNTQNLKISKQFFQMNKLNEAKMSNYLTLNYILSNKWFYSNYHDYYKYKIMKDNPPIIAKISIGFAIYEFLF